MILLNINSDEDGLEIIRRLRTLRSEVFLETPFLALKVVLARNGDFGLEIIQNASAEYDDSVDVEGLSFVGRDRGKRLLSVHDDRDYLG